MGVLSFYFSSEEMYVWAFTVTRWAVICERGRMFSISRVRLPDGFKGFVEKLKPLHYKKLDACFDCVPSCVKHKYSKWSETTFTLFRWRFMERLVPDVNLHPVGKPEAWGFEPAVLRSPASNPFSTASRVEHTDYIWREFTLVKVHPSSRHSSGAVISQSIYVI